MKTLKEHVSKLQKKVSYKRREWSCRPSKLGSSWFRRQQGLVATVGTSWDITIGEAASSSWAMWLAREGLATARSCDLSGEVGRAWCHVTPLHSKIPAQETTHHERPPHTSPATHGYSNHWMAKRKHKTKMSAQPRITKLWRKPTT